LLQLQADIAVDPVQAERFQREADRANSDVLAWALATRCLREAIQLNLQTQQLLTGNPVKAERPRLRM
jgi:hypothetical protein